MEGIHVQILLTLPLVKHIFLTFTPFTQSLNPLTRNRTYLYEKDPHGVNALYSSSWTVSVHFT